MMWRQPHRPERRAGRIPTAAHVKRFWESHPVAAAGIPAEPGSPEFFRAFDELRELDEPLDFAGRFYAYAQAAGRRVLDVGCGNGYVLRGYAHHGATAVGVDLTRTALGLTRRRFALAGLPAPALVEASAELLPFPAASFDAVTCMGVVHHTPDDARAIRELIRVLRPGGRLMLMVYHRNSLLYRITFPLARRLSRTFRGWDPQRLVNHVDGADNPLGRVYSRRELARLLGGCDVVAMTAGCLREMLPPLGPIRDPVAWLPQPVVRILERRFGWQLYLVAVKRADGAAPSAPGP